ncbi:MAG: hypothetical protein HXY34_08450 [Candidatus Thorarchaeota archaeon]|nr:hypothetical protein [Candidatus Thorarchaeota archaeon]
MYSLVGTRRDIAKVLLIVPLTLGSTLLAIGGVSIVSLSHATRVGVHTLLAYWASIPAAAVIVTLFRRFSRARMILASAFLLVVVSNVERALRHIVPVTEVPAQIHDGMLVAQQFGLMLVVLLLVVASVTRDEPQDSLSRGYSRVFGLATTLTPLVVYVYVDCFVASEPSPLATAIGIVACAVAVSGLLVMPRLAYRLRREYLPLDCGYFVTACVLLIGSSLLLTESFITSSLLWIYAENLQTAALLLFGVSLGVPLLRRTGYGRRASYGMVVFLALSAYLPLLVTTILESASRTEPFEAGNVLAYAIVHVGMASLSAIMAALLTVYSRVRPSRTQYPLSMVFIVWTGVAFISIVPAFTASPIPLGTSNAPYLVGSIVTLFFLYLVHKWYWENNSASLVMSPRRFLASASLVLLAVGVAEGMNQIIWAYGLIQHGNLIGNRMLLGFNSLVMFGIAYLVFMLSSSNADAVPFESFITGFLVVWIVPYTLKSYYLPFTPGWWVSELVMFLGLLTGPALVGFLYMRAMQQAEESHKRAAMYADLLMHDITNHNQITLTTLELLSSESMNSDTRERLLRDARHAVSMADQLIGNVRLLNDTEIWQRLTETRTDLVSEVVHALDTVMQNLSIPGLVINISTETSRAYVLGNNLLRAAILNLLYTAVELPRETEEMWISVVPIVAMGRDWWQVKLEIPKTRMNTGLMTSPDPETVTHGRSSLGFLVAKIVVNQLGGYMENGLGSRDDFGVVSYIALNLPICH